MVDLVTVTLISEHQLITATINSPFSPWIHHYHKCFPYHFFISESYPTIINYIFQTIEVASPLS